MRSPRGDPGNEGIWEILEHCLPFPAAHAALLPTGKVFLLPGGRKQVGANGTATACLWDSQTGASRTWNLPTDFSLGAHCFLSDGRLVVTGGCKEQSAIRLKETYLFDPAGEDFLRVSDIPERGPCPAMVELGDGSVVAVGGSGESHIHAYDKTSGWSVSADSGLDWPLYPQLTLLADGSLFYSGQHFGGRTLIGPGILSAGGRFAELPQEATPPGFSIEFREQGETVLLPPAQDQRVMIIGGGSPPSPDVHVLDLYLAEPVLRSSHPLHRGRASFNTVILPDHSLLVCSGVRSDQGGRSAARETELYNPSTGRWTLGAAAEVPRLEHSSSILLPDGRVLTVGSTDGSGLGELRAELFHPPYLFHGDRPVVTEVPENITLGESFSIKTADSDIRRISLVKPMAVSHGVDSGQRLVDVPFESRGGGVLEAVAPENPNIAPPGRYLVFLVNHYGTPSLGQWVQLHPPASPGSHDLETHAGQASQTFGRHSWNGAHSHGSPPPTAEPADPPGEFEDALLIDDSIDFFEPDRTPNRSAPSEIPYGDAEPLRLFSTDASPLLRRRRVKERSRSQWSGDPPPLLEQQEAGSRTQEPQDSLLTGEPAIRSLWDPAAGDLLTDEPARRSESGDRRRPLLEEPALRSWLEEPALYSQGEGPVPRSLLEEPSNHTADEPARHFPQEEPHWRSLLEEPPLHFPLRESSLRTLLEEREPALNPSPDEPAHLLWAEEPALPALHEARVDDTWVGARPERSWLPVERVPSWLDQEQTTEPEPASGYPSARSSPSVSGTRSPWYSWARPVLVIGSSALLALSMVVDLPPLRAAAAFLFLLIAPGMALVGLLRPSGWASEVALAVGLSVALETLLTVAMLYFRVWSTDRILLTLLVLSLCGAAAQLIKAAFGRVERVRDVERWSEAPA